jgi:hypothetical protein
MVQPVGLVVSPAALVRAQVYPTHPVIQQQQSLKDLVSTDGKEEDDPVLHDFPSFCQQVLGWRRNDLMEGSQLPESLTISLPEYSDVLSPTYAVPDPDHPDSWLMLIEVRPPGENLDRARSGDHAWHATPQERFQRMLRETGVPIGLLVNGHEIRLVYAPSGESPGHISFPISAMCEVAGRPILAACHMLLAEDALFSRPTAQRLPKLLSESRKFQTEVSIKLAEQVLEALNELLRGFGAADRATGGKLLGDALRSAPDHVYGGMLSVLLRLVFILYAEERGLLPTTGLYLDNYSVIGLFERLRADAARFTDTMDNRFSAWPRLLTLFRLIYDGGAHATMVLPPRHGSLFDPDAYPFLEGRPFGSRRVVGERIAPPRVGDGFIYRVLDKLLILDGERLSYRALDVEQIGSVYEAMMGFELRTAIGPSLAVRPDHIVVNLQQILDAAPAERARLLKDTTGCDLTGNALEALKTAHSIDEIEVALARRKSLHTPRILAPGEMYLQPTEERRRSGSHYTPRSLTEPIVKTTLRPIFEAMGERPKPEQILDLKICDPAMGSGAFLVEACRLLADKLVTAWNTHGGIPKIPPDEDPHLYARRIVAQRCLYGVDKNPFAVDLAKLSLWLATLARDHPFTFLDHALRCGDSLVGLTAEQIKCFKWDLGIQVPLIRQVLDEAVKEAEALRVRIQALAGSDDTDEKSRLLREAEEALDNVRLVGDLAIAAFFGAEKKKEREQLREKYEAKVRNFAAATKEGNWSAAKQELHSFVADTLGGAKPIDPLHWEIEFPEVFSRSNSVFDAFLGNPPFAGKNSIRASGGDCYIPYLLAIHNGSHGNSDLVAHFFRRAFGLVRRGAVFGLIATNTIAQGDTRHTGLTWICTHGGKVYSAERRYRWPGQAAVVVSVVYVKRGSYEGRWFLDHKPVEKITSFLFNAGGDEDPVALESNKGKAFIGSYVLGMGFTFDDSNPQATPIAEMHRLVASDPRNRERIFPYLGGEEINSSPAQAFDRYVISFGEMSEEEARRWPDLMDIVERKVRPSRRDQGSIVNPERWWHHARPASDLFTATRELKRMLVLSRIGQACAFAFVPSDWLPAESLVVFASESLPFFAVVQARTHEVWARFFSSSMKDDLRYAPSDCFETFPFPPTWECNESLERVGKVYYEFRASLMIRNNEGLTRTYNRFRYPEQRDPDILKLRKLHDAMDRAVLDAYGWTDLKPTCEFILDYEEEDADQNGRRRKRRKPWRYRWPDEFRDEVLARLLALNQERAAQEKIMGTGSDGARQKGKSRRKGAEAGSAKRMFD